MATMATNFSIEQPQLLHRPLRIAQLSGSLRASDEAPWLYSALTQVWEVEQSGENIAGLGDTRISEQTATRARLLLAMIDLTELPSPQVSPVSGGGISIQWEMGPKEVKFSFYPDGATMFYQSQDDEITKDGLLRTIMPNEVTGPLKWMLDVRS